MACRRRMFVGPCVGDELELADGTRVKVLEVVGLEVAVEVITRKKEKWRRSEWELQVLGAFAVVPVAAAESSEAGKPT